MLHISEKDGYTIARIDLKRIDVSNVNELNEELNKLKMDKDILLDMSGLQFIDSSGLGIIVGYYKKFKKSNRVFGLMGVNDRVAGILQIVGLLGIVKIFKSEEDYKRFRDESNNQA
ncbi:MAG: STAS domain-containing protein [Calditerrivibrio sp.]|nr:STAS domain-containing protein [Calditerrivibrio sp.]